MDRRQKLIARRYIKEFIAEYKAIHGTVPTKQEIVEEVKTQFGENIDWEALIEAIIKLIELIMELFG